MKKIWGLLTLAQLLGSASAVLASGTTLSGIQSTDFPFANLGEFIGVVVSAIFIIAALAAFLYLVLGGFQYITSGGDKVGAQAARDRITYAILGLAIIAAAGAIVGVLQAVFGVTILGNIKWPGPARTVGT